jgi:hypothetical protein
VEWRVEMEQLEESPDGKFDEKLEDCEGKFEKCVLQFVARFNIENRRIGDYCLPRIIAAAI